MKIHRRELLKLFGLLAAGGWLPAWAAGEAGTGNFHTVYDDPTQRERFRLFLQNVFHLYPEDRFHQLIGEAVKGRPKDAEIYREIQRRLPDIKPALAALSYALPALAKQKQEMASETARLLDDRPKVDGYLEIGTPGRYVRSLGKQIQLTGDVFLVHDHKPDFGINDVVERGGLSQVGHWYPLNDYAEWGSEMPDAHFEVVTNFIGLHHSPPERLDGFVKSIRRVLRPNGIFILRDHDADTATMGAMVGLAHDVFNAGLQAPWEKNEAEIRHFKSLAQIETYLKGFGFTREKEPLFQAGDPTRNALMRFRKT